MAAGVMHILAENYVALEDVFKNMGVLDSSRCLSVVACTLGVLCSGVL